MACVKLSCLLLGISGTNYFIFSKGSEGCCTLAYTGMNLEGSHSAGGLTQCLCIKHEVRGD